MKVEGGGRRVKANVRGGRDDEGEGCLGSVRRGGLFGERAGGWRWREEVEVWGGGSGGNGKREGAYVLSRTLRYLLTYTHIALQQLRSLRVTCRLPQSTTYERLAATPAYLRGPFNRNYSNCTQAAFLFFPYSSPYLITLDLA